MKKNLFEGAEFGNMYQTRDGRRATFISHYEGSNNPFGIPEHVQLFVEKDGRALDFYMDGRIWRVNMYQHESDGHEGIDIVSRYHEPVDEKKLDKLADEYERKITENQVGYVEYNLDSFKAGYRKAKDE